MRHEWGRAVSGRGALVGAGLALLLLLVLIAARGRGRRSAPGAAEADGSVREPGDAEASAQWWNVRELIEAGVQRQEALERRARAERERAAGSALPPSAKIPVVRELSSPELLKQPFAARLIVSERLRAVFCPMPKAANSNWKYAIRKLEGIADYADLAAAHQMSTSGLRYLTDYSPRDVDAILYGNPQRGVLPFFKFVFVRDPYTRLLSAYNDKFALKNTSSEEYRLFVAQILSWKAIRGRDLSQEPRISFRTFVDELLKQDVAHMNAHWMPQALVCGLGYVPYDFVGSFEHLGTDAAAVLAHLGHPEEKFPTQQEIGFPPSGTRAMIDELYTREIMLKARVIYDQDFLLLGY